jgi:hypothetical protein
VFVARQRLDEDEDVEIGVLVGLTADVGAERSKADEAARNEPLHASTEFDQRRAGVFGERHPHLRTRPKA